MKKKLAKEPWIHKVVLSAEHTQTHTHTHRPTRFAHTSAEEVARTTILIAGRHTAAATKEILFRRRKFTWKGCKHKITRHYVHCLGENVRNFLIYLYVLYFIPDGFDHTKLI